MCLTILLADNIQIIYSTKNVFNKVGFFIDDFTSTAHKMVIERLVQSLDPAKHGIRWALSHTR